jgi:aminoglycoside 3-N-acetyltransferase I
MRTHRLTSADVALGRRVFALLREVFEEPGSGSERGAEGPRALGDAYLEKLLANDAFWAFAAFVGDELAGGLTAHTLPMTRDESSEVFIYDVAVHPSYQRKGVGRALIQSLRDAAAEQGIREVFVPADNEDTHALDFYRAVGGEASAVTFFGFSR